jgi:hypothetical protein
MLLALFNFLREGKMKVGSLLAIVAAFALAIFATSTPSPVLSTKAFAQNTSGSTTPTTKKKGGANADKPKGTLYKSPGDRARCRMGNC